MSIDDPKARTKLLSAKGEIEEILKRYDLAGFIVLHSAPCSAEVIVNLSPSYSKVTLLADGVAKIQSFRRDYPSAEAQAADMAATASMLNMMGAFTFETARTLGLLCNLVDEITGAEHGELTKVMTH
jgi:hypothetical protein